MNSLRIFLFYTSLLCSHYVVKVESQNEKALVFDVENYELMEIDEKNETAKCPNCITACAASSNSEDEKRMKTDAAIDKNAIFLKQVYNKDEDTKNIETDFCEDKLTPSIVWDSESAIFLIGYEMFYDQEKITTLSCSLYEDSFERVIEGKPNTDWQKPTPAANENNEFIKTYYDDRVNLNFEIVFDLDSKQIWAYYFIEVLAIDVHETQNRRMITLTKDTFNDFYQHNDPINQCENYFIGGAEEENKSQKTDQGDTTTKEKVDGKRKKLLPQKRDKNRLEKTQILPMQMFHTYSARLATCMYMNIAFIWNNVANGPLKEVDLFLYSMYRLWPDELNIRYVVQGEIETNSDTIASEDQLFRKYPIPELIYRIIELRYSSHEYKAVVVIHNDPNPVQKKNRICADPIESWNVMNENSNTDSKIEPSYYYTCPVSRDVIYKLKLNVQQPSEALDLKSFPEIDHTDKETIPEINNKNKKEINFVDVTQKIRDELDRHKEKVVKKSLFSGFDQFKSNIKSIINRK